MRAADRTDYIVRCLMDAGSMYEDGARSFLAEHDADQRAEVLTDAQEETLRLAAAYLIRKYRPTNRAAADLVRLAELETQGRSALIPADTARIARNGTEETT